MAQEIADGQKQSEVERLVELYDLQPHPEGGWFKETFRSTAHCQNEHLHGNKDSRVATVCYYLLPKNGMSHWHRLASDEIWLYHDGGCLKVCDNGYLTSGWEVKAVEGFAFQTHYKATLALTDPYGLKKAIGLPEHLPIHMIDEKGVYSSAVLGSSLEHPEARYGVSVPAEVWLAAEPTNGGNFSLISCLVAPGFEWKGFEMGREEDLVTSFPHLADIIKPYCQP
ncbi:Hypp7721 [Branchiostoma lanceolatum]|uniref:Hypp7721 protein n=1 Tax=Branchiostoma lanceolatum TaxID=7740 RepID=A0A8J9Z2L1_BRALA|nr:Hypp7721 [Branchiostoma lanceolatum]